jgi:uncharacterized protein (DUF1800 family)
MKFFFQSEAMSEWSIALNRFGLGRRAGEALGSDPRAWLANQLVRFDPAPPRIAAAPATQAAFASVTDTRAEARNMPEMRLDDAEMAAQRSDTGPRAAARREGRRAYDLSVAARIEAAVASETPFAERLVHFWSNHFAVSADKQAIIAALSGGFEFEAIRPHVMGNFADMLKAVERHPAMLLFLDQARSVGPNSAHLRGRPDRGQGLNENLGREILELHTLGVRGGYTQQDVLELSRALTGWTVAGGGGAPALRSGPQARPGQFVFASEVHEPGSRTVLGRTFAEGGADQATRILDYLAGHQATARHIATKLARHFAGDDPPAALVGRLEQSFVASGGDLPALYRTLIESPEVWEPEPLKFKSPWEWTISSLRALGGRAAPPRATSAMLNQMGQRVWAPGSPAGFDDIAAAWLGPDGLTRRVSIAERLAGSSGSRTDPRELAEALFPDSLSPETERAIARAQDSVEGLALLLVSPEMLRR